MPDRRPCPTGAHARLLQNNAEASLCAQPHSKEVMRTYAYETRGVARPFEQLPCTASPPCTAPPSRTSTCKPALTRSRAGLYGTNRKRQRDLVTSTSIF